MAIQWSALPDLECFEIQNSLAFSLLEKLVGRGRLKFKRGFNWTWEPCCKQIPLHFVPNRHHCFFSSNHRHFKPDGPSLEVESESVCLSLGVRLTPSRSWYHGYPTCVTESITISSFFFWWPKCDAIVCVPIRWKWKVHYGGPSYKRKGFNISFKNHQHKKRTCKRHIWNPRFMISVSDHAILMSLRQTKPS